MEELVFENVSLTYHSKESETLAVSNFNLKINQGELIGIVGPSGCGKTTILSLISGLVETESGNILIQGLPVCEAKGSTAYMLQKDQLFAWRSIFKNVMLGLEIQGRKTPETVAYANALLDKYGLSEFKNHYPSQLSGGMRQRVALIRTLVLSPQILLLDEPFSALDFQTRLNVCNDVQRIIKEEGKTAVFVTHDISEAISVSDKIVVLTQRPASVREVVDLKEIASLEPLKRRENSKFSVYFEKIWRLLE